MGKPNLRPVSNDVDLGQDFEAEVTADLAYEPAAAKRRVKTMIRDTSSTLKKVIETYRVEEATAEATKAAAHDRFKLAVELAKQERDACLAEADADLHQIRQTIEALEPARARLAETA